MKTGMKVTIGTGLAFTVLASNPAIAQAKSSSDFVTEKTKAIQKTSNGVEAIFNTKDKTRKSFYGSRVKSKGLDRKVGNRLYKVSQHGFDY